MERRAFVGGAAAAAAVGLVPAWAQEKFPSKPIEVVTHAGVGGGTDITARMMMVHAPGGVRDRARGREPRRRQRRRGARLCRGPSEATATPSCW